MRILYMGTPDIAVPTLECIVDAGHQVIGVVTQPDKPKGRGGTVQFPPVKAKAVELDIPVYQPRRVRAEEFLEVVRELAPDAIVVFAFGQILPQALLDIPRYGCINVHASLLPMYRGAAPIQWVIIDGQKETGVTIMQMDAGLDTGDMLKKMVVPIADDETGGSLHDKLMLAGGPLLLETLQEIEAGTVIAEKQTGETCYAAMLDKALGNVDWTISAARIERLIRGLNPWPSAYTRWNGKTMKLWKANVLPAAEEGAMVSGTVCGSSVATGNQQEAQKAIPGTVVSLEGGICVQTGDGILQITELQLEGKKRMDAAAFLRGAHVAVGDVLTQA